METFFLKVENENGILSITWQCRQMCKILTITRHPDSNRSWAGCQWSASASHAKQSKEEGHFSITFLFHKCKTNNSLMH
jgi:hypothetical protein